MHFRDMNNNIWRAIEIVLKMDRLPVVKELRHIIQILGTVDPVKTVVIKGHEEPVEYYCTKGEFRKFPFHERTKETSYILLDLFFLAFSSFQWALSALKKWTNASGGFGVD